MTLKVFWQPDGETLDSIGSKRLVDISDGDTPNIRMNVRMLSIDTPEKRGGDIGEAELNELLPEMADWIEGGTSPVEPDLAAHLVPRLRRDKPASAHIAQGEQATAEFERVTEARLRRPSGRKRSLFVRIADAPFDRYGRILAYVAPSYSAAERAGMTRQERATFNYSMVASGWAAPFVIFPSVPGERDLPMFRQAALDAVEGRKGAWADPLLLTGYEFRSTVRLAVVFRKVRGGARVAADQWYGWISRYCADVTTGQLYAPQDYVKVKPYDRLFVFPEDVRAAVAALNLTPAGRLAG